RVAARELIPVEAVDRHGVREDAAVWSRDGLPMTLDRIFVLFAPANLPNLCHVFAVLAHALSGHAVLDLGDKEAHVAGANRSQSLEASRRLSRLHHAPELDGETGRDADLDAAQALGSADQRQSGPSTPQHSGGFEGTGHARAALEDGRERRHVRVEARFEPDLAGEI